MPQLRFEQEFTIRGYSILSTDSDPRILYFAYILLSETGRIGNYEYGTVKWLEDITVGRTLVEKIMSYLPSRLALPEGVPKGGECDRFTDDIPLWAILIDVAVALGSPLSLENSFRKKRGIGAMKWVTE